MTILNVQRTNVRIPAVQDGTMPMEERISVILEMAERMQHCLDENSFPVYLFLRCGL